MIYQDVTRIIEQQPSIKETYGKDLIDLPSDQLILRGVKFPYNEGTMELTITTEAAYPTFEWLAEITIKEPENVEHFLLRADQTIVETYGKNVIDVDSTKAEYLHHRLRQIT